MACSVTIESVTRRENDVGATIIVTGTSDNCSELVVTLECGDHTVEHEVHHAEGSWEVSFDDPGCECFEQVRVKADCAEEANVCSSGPFFDMLECCRLQGDITVEVGGCDEEGRREVSFSFGVGAEISGDMDFGDGSSVILDNDDSTGHAYAVPGSYEARLEMEGCDDVVITVGPLDACGEVGVCCLEDGTCQEWTEEACADEPGSAWMRGLECGPGICPPTGACCLPDDTCRQLTAIGCANRNGDWLGVGTGCDQCPQPKRACCLPDGTCATMTEDECAAANGDFQPDDLTCDGVTCPQPTGACCLDGEACRVTTQFECERVHHGEWQGAGSTCDVCPGACCFHDRWCERMTEEACEEQGGWFKGSGSDCAECPPPVGACCLPDGSCIERNRETCEGKRHRGTYQGDGTVCRGMKCPQPPGGTPGEDEDEDDDGRRRPSGCGFNICTLLLGMAISTILAAGVLAVVAGCAANLIVAIIAAGAAVLGLALLALWALICASRAWCEELLGLRRMFAILAIVSAITGAVQAALAAAGVILMPCLGGVFAAGAYYAGILGVLDLIIDWIPCLVPAEE